MRWSCGKRLAYMVANLFAKESEKRRQSTREKLENNLCKHFPDSAEKRPSR